MPNPCREDKRDMVIRSRFEVLKITFFFRRGFMDCFVYSGAPFDEFPLSFSIKGIMIGSGYAFEDEF